MSYNNCQFTWLKQKETLISLAESLLKDGEYFDCQLYAEGHHFNVHRVILSCNSPVFSNILQEHTSDFPVITLEGITATELGALVEFMYTGVTRISPKYFKNFLQLAQSLQLAGLSSYDNFQNEKLLNCIVDSKTEDSYYSYSENIFKYLDQSDLHSESDEKVVGSFIENDESVFLDETVEQDEIINEEESVVYDNEFVKVETEEGVESSELLVEVNNLSQNDTVESNEIEETDTESFLMYNKYHSVLIKNQDKNFGGNVATVYNISSTDELNLKDSSEFITFKNEVKDADEEDFVYAKLDNEALDRLKETQPSKEKQNPSKNDVRVYAKKCLKVINPGKKNFLIKPSKLQSVVKETKGNGDDKKIYICLKCGNKYSHRRTLLHHIQWICEQPATYLCSLCPYMGKRKFQLKSHMKHAHLLKMS